MSLHVIVDGYNLIRQSDSLRPLDRAALELGRDALVDQLAAYKRLKHHKITVVFDGSQRYLFPGPTFSEKGITVRFSRQGESADAVIKRMAAREREKAVVVTSDHGITDFAASCGAATIGSVEFTEKMAMAQVMSEKGADPAAEAADGWTPTTRKKGPRKRLPKRARKKRSKIKKL